VGIKPDLPPEGEHPIFFSVFLLSVGDFITSREWWSLTCDLVDPEASAPSKQSPGVVTLKASEYACGPGLCDKEHLKKSCGGDNTPE
jgi:hypothetical protein